MDRSNELDALPDGAPTLDGLRPGTLAEVSGISGNGPASRRLRELGFCSGTIVELVRRAPLGDPILFSLRGARICLRRSEAERIGILRGAATNGARTNGTGRDDGKIR